MAVSKKKQDWRVVEVVVDQNLLDLCKTTRDHIQKLGESYYLDRGRAGDVVVFINGAGTRTRCLEHKGNGLICIMVPPRDLDPSLKEFMNAMRVFRLHAKNKKVEAELTALIHR
jgi:hypothetical protein